MAVLGIDLGTSAVKALVLDEQGAILSVAKADYAVLAPHPGWAESNPQKWWTATISAVQAALAQMPQFTTITTIGLAGQMHGVVLTAKDGQPLRDALLWPDTRAEKELELYKGLATSTLLRLANPLVPGMAGPMLCWLAQHEAATYQASRWALQPKDWLRLCLTDTIATDPSDASATLLYDLPADQWADDVIAALGLERELFPPILPSGAVAGTLSVQAATTMGLSPGLPVAVGAADTAAAILGTGLFEPGLIQLTLGTGAQLVQLQAQPVADASGNTHLYRAAEPNNWYGMAAVQNAGLALDWVRRTLRVSWEELYASAAWGSPGAEGLVFRPYLTRERTHYQATSSGGAFLGLRIHHQPEHLWRAALEGVACGIRLALEALPGASRATALRLAGGGSVHPAWRQLLCNLLNRELVILDTPAASSRGAALLGGIAAGIWPNARATSPLTPLTSTIVTPDSKQAALYAQVYTNYLNHLTRL